MQCPKCGARTEVVEKRGEYRDRRCTSTDCRLDFTTQERVMKPRQPAVKPRQHGRLCARTRAALTEAPPVSRLSGEFRATAGGHSAAAEFKPLANPQKG